MMSSTLPPIDDRVVGQHPAVVELMKGIFNSNPPKPKYATTWDVDLVVRYLGSMPENNDLSLIQLGRKTAMLLALVTMFRVSEVASIDLPSMIFSVQGLVLTLSKLRKTQQNGQLVTRQISRLQDRKICPVETTLAYIQATNQLRNDSNSSHLLISSVKPHKPVTGSTVGHWIKKVLKDAGVDSTIFSAHSTRGAAASKAAAKGVPTDSILKTASWSKESTFIKFYKRNVTQPDTGAIVLTPESSTLSNSSML